MKAFSNGKNIIVFRYYFPLGWKVYANGDWIANISWGDEVKDYQAELLSAGYKVVS